MDGNFSGYQIYFQLLLHKLSKQLIKLYYILKFQKKMNCKGHRFPCDEKVNLVWSSV